ncbi:hypothetical protein SAMN04488515_2681 [Cognatiyoonia koreensis]|uniref:Uncharacterized protein n=1 Tax=Cognatiyoonia koreensis TaxID=364200 RepID=A0A1I0RH05_9RHOB|nr:hypothetical protein SAMN04488515_2681 [Cognatiyoonia koreensis]
MRPNFFGAPRPNTSDILIRLASRLSAFPRLSGPSGVPLVLVSAAGEGGSTVSDWYPQPLFFTKMHFFQKT